jgi:hypothetical protein
VAIPGLTKRLAGTGGWNPFRIFYIRACRLHAKPGGRSNGIGRFCFFLSSKVFGVEVDREGRSCRVRPGGHLVPVGRFCRRSPSPRPRRQHSTADRFQIGSRRSPDAPRPLARCAAVAIRESPLGNHLLFFFAQDVAHIDEGYMPHAEISVPGLILVGRFSSDPHWPVLGDPEVMKVRKMAAQLCQKCKQSHPGRVCDYDGKPNAPKRLPSMRLLNQVTSHQRTRQTEVWLKV